MLRRLLNDKEIGRRFILTQKKLYSVSSNEWDAYNNSISNRYSRNYTNHTPTSISSDTIIGLNHEHEIKALKMDILALHSRINQLTNTVDNNHNEVADALFIFASEIRKNLDDFSNKK